MYLSGFRWWYTSGTDGGFSARLATVSQETPSNHWCCFTSSHPRGPLPNRRSGFTSRRLWTRSRATLLKNDGKRKSPSEMRRYSSFWLGPKKGAYLRAHKTMVGFQNTTRTRLSASASHC